MISRALVRLAAGPFLLATVLAAPAALAQPAPGLIPLLQVESTGITLSRLEVFFCSTCAGTDRILETRQLTVFTDRSVVGVTSSNNLDDAAGPSSIVIEAKGSRDQFAVLTQALAAAKRYASLPGCSASFERTPRPPRPDSVLRQTVNHDYRLTWHDGGNTLHTFVIDSTQPRCPPALRDLVYQVVQYADGAASRTVAY